MGPERIAMTIAFNPVQHAKSIGYTEGDMQSVPEGLIAHGCGNPIGLADLKEGEIVLDVGSGGGLDSLLAARRVGPQGKVIGVDKSAEIIATATANAIRGSYTNVMFEVGSMDHLPVASESVDVAISNCVINHAADKVTVFQELFRCLRPNGRMIVTDLMAEGEFPPAALHDDVWGVWLTQASDEAEYLEAIRRGGFKNVAVVSKGTFPMAEADEQLRGRIVSIAVKAYKE
jgi:arsenite methyltransferase